MLSPIHLKSALILCSSMVLNGCFSSDDDVPVIGDNQSVNTSTPSTGNTSFPSGGGESIAAGDFVIEENTPEDIPTETPTPQTPVSTAPPAVVTPDAPGQTTEAPLNPESEGTTESSENATTEPSEAPAENPTEVSTDLTEPEADKPIQEDTDTVSETPTETDGPSESLYNVTLSWNLPEHRIDGEPLLLSEISGYQVVYQNTDSNETSQVTVDSPTKDSVLLANLTPGRYVFKIATIDSDSQQGEFSKPIEQNL